MSTQRAEVEYRCSQDCEQSGCPGHTLTVELSNADTVAIVIDGNVRTVVDRAVIEALHSLIIDPCSAVNSLGGMT